MGGMPRYGGSESPFTNIVMNENINLILAAGNQTRWNSEKILGIPQIKQLVEVKEEILIESIQRQFRESIVITKNESIRKHSFKWFDPEFTDVTIATLFSTRNLWKDWTTILLGDVDYGDHTIHQIKKQKNLLMFYGDKEEIYAFKFHKSVQLSIIQAIHATAMSELFEPKFGKLWNLYRTLNQKDIRVHVIEKYFTFVKDCRDFDTQPSYLKRAKGKTIRS